MLRTARPSGASVAASSRSSITRSLSPMASCSSAMRASRSASAAAFASRRFCARDGCAPPCRHNTLALISILLLHAFPIHEDQVRHSSVSMTAFKLLCLGLSSTKSKINQR